MTRTASGYRRSRADTLWLEAQSTHVSVSEYRSAQTAEGKTITAPISGHIVVGPDIQPAANGEMYLVEVSAPSSDGRGPDQEKALFAFTSDRVRLCSERGEIVEDHNLAIAAAYRYLRPLAEHCGVAV
jgi:hypothetical protein